MWRWRGGRGPRQGEIDRTPPFLEGSELRLALSREIASIFGWDPRCFWKGPSTSPLHVARLEQPLSPDAPRGMRSLSLCLAFALPAAALDAAAQSGAKGPAAQGAAAARPQYYVVELYNSDTTTLEQVLGVFEKLGATEEKAMPAIEKIDQKGKAVVVVGSQESCNQAAEEFHQIGMKTEVRLLTKEDMTGPTDYDDSDVILAGAEELNQVIDSGEGFLINFFSPTCAPCKRLAPEYKEVATALKEVPR